MSINTQLSDLQSNLQAAKDSFATILTNKGITTLTQYSPLQDMIDSVDTIQTGGSAVFDFGSIGYTGTEEPFKSYYDYAKPIYDTWNPSLVNLNAKFKDNTTLTCMPLVDTSNATTMYEMFKGCKNLEVVPLLNTSNVTDMSQMFKGINASIFTKLKSVPCFNTINVTTMSQMFGYSTVLTTIPSFNTINVTDMGYMFYFCKGLTTIPSLDTSKVTNFYSMFGNCTSLTKVTQLDFSSIDTTDSWIDINLPILVYMLIKNIGKSSCTVYDFSKVINWGTGVSDNRQSLIDSLITYSYNRKANSMSNAIIQLSTTTKALLTAGEIASISAKGFTLATV